MGTDTALGPAKRQFGCSVYEANDHGFLLRSMVGHHAQNFTREAFTAAVHTLLPLIERRIPVAYDSFGDKFPIGSVIRNNNLKAVATLATSFVRNLHPEAIQDLLIAYGRHHYFEVDCTDLRFLHGSSMSPLQQAIVYSSLPAVLAFIELGAAAEAPKTHAVADQVLGSLPHITEGVEPEFQEFAGFVNEHYRRGTPAYEAIMSAVRTRSMRQEIARAQGSANRDGASADTAVVMPAPSARRRGI